MGRTIAGVVVGYVLMALIVFGSFTAAYLAMGADRAFLPGTHDVSPLWIGVSFILGFIAAAIGGLACAAIARNRTGPKALAAACLVLGFIMALGVVFGHAAPKERTAEIGNMDAMMQAVQPTWVAMVNPLIGAAGVMVGASLRRREP